MYGMKHIDCEAQLFREKREELNVENVVTLAASYETADNTAALLQQTSAQTPSINVNVHSIYKTQYKINNKRTFEKFIGQSVRCGKVDHHKPENCKFKNATCFKCSQAGHIVPACFISNSKNGKFNKIKNKKLQAAEIETDYTSDEEETNYVCAVEIEGAPKLLSDIFINGEQVIFEVDIGTGVTLLNCIAWQEIGFRHLKLTKLKFKSYSGHKLPTLGCFATNVNYNGKLLYLPVSQRKK